MNDERMELMKQWEKMSEKPTTIIVEQKAPAQKVEEPKPEPKVEEAKKEPVVEQKKEEPKPDLKKDDTATSAEKKEVSETPADKKGDTGTQPEKKGGIKMVPHEALHEEREKRKTIQAERDAEKARADALASEIERLKMQNENNINLDEITPDSDKELKKLKAEVMSLKDEYRKRDESERVNSNKRAQMELQQNLDKTNSLLEKEGISGFNTFVPLVTQELRKLVEEDNGNIHLDNPEGWAHIYRTKVYPSISNMFVKKIVDDKTEEKKRIKEDANLVGSPGSAPIPKKDAEKEWDAEAAFNWKERKTISY